MFCHEQWKLRSPDTPCHGAEGFPAPLSRCVEPLDTHVLVRISRSFLIINVLKWVRKLKGRWDKGSFLGHDILTDITAKQTHTNFLEKAVVVVMLKSQYLLST